MINLAQHIDEIDYVFERIASGSFRPGGHPSVASGRGNRLIRITSFLDKPEAHNVDWFLTAVTGAGMPLVSVYEQKSVIKVYVIADLTASLGFRGMVRKQEEMAKLVASLGFSAYRVGDPFSLIGYGGEEMQYFEPKSDRKHGLDMGEWLLEHASRGNNHEGVLEATSYLPTSPSMVFWLSDFNFDLTIARRFFDEVSEIHDVIPVVFWDSAEFRDLPVWSWITLCDSESGNIKHELLTPGRKQQLITSVDEHLASLNSICVDYHILPITITNLLEPEVLVDFFLNRDRV